MYIKLLNSIPMGKKSPVAIFMAATAILATNAIQPGAAQADEMHMESEFTHQDASLSSYQAADMGGTQEWNTEQTIDAESKPDADATAQQEEWAEEEACVPIGEGENCW